MYNNILNSPDREPLFIGLVIKPREGLFNFNIMKEIWKDIPGYEGYYQASNLGRIKSLKRYVKHPSGGMKIIKKRIMKTASNKKGYFHLSLSKNGIIKTCRVSRLIAKTFISNSEKKPEVNHKNGIKSDNCITNLEWVTRSENEIHAFATGLKHSSRSMLGRFGAEHNRSMAVLQYDLQGNFIAEYGGLLEASRITKIHLSTIIRCAKCHTINPRTYIWKYKNNKND